MSTTQLARRLAAAAAVSAAAVTVPLVSTAQAQTAGPEVPDNIAVEDGHKVFLVGHATGVQIYTCLATGAWSAATPRADLVGDNGKLIATHFGGPTWQTRDGSRVVAQRVDGAPATEPNAVPWLLLPVAEARSLLLFGLGVAAACVVLDVASLGAAFNVAKLVALTLLGFWFLRLFEELSWVVLVAALIPWADIFSVYRGPTRQVVEERPGVFERIAVEFSLPGEHDAARIGPPLIVQPMIPKGTELLAGLVQDPVFGPLVAFGPGGVFAELIGRATFRIAPLTDVDATELVTGGPAGRLVAGFRGAPAADVDALTDLVHRLGRLGEHHCRLETARAAGDGHRDADTERGDLERRQVDRGGGVGAAVGVADGRALGGTGAGAGGAGEGDELLVLGGQVSHGWPPGSGRRRRTPRSGSRRSPGPGRRG